MSSFLSVHNSKYLNYFVLKRPSMHQNVLPNRDFDRRTTRSDEVMTNFLHRPWHSDPVATSPATVRFNIISLHSGTGLNCSALFFPYELTSQKWVKSQLNILFDVCIKIILLWWKAKKARQNKKLKSLLRTYDDLIRKINICNVIYFSRKLKSFICSLFNVTGMDFSTYHYIYLHEV